MRAYSSSSSSSSTLQRRSINRRRGLLLLRIETLDSAASTFNFNTFGIKEMVEQGPWDKHPSRDTDSDHAECGDSGHSLWDSTKETADEKKQLYENYRAIPKSLRAIWEKRIRTCIIVEYKKH